MINKESQKNLKQWTTKFQQNEWLKNNFSTKLENKWIGPYYIHNVLKDNVYKLRTLDSKSVKNVMEIDLSYIIRKIGTNSNY